MFFVYVLKSKKDGKTYTGYTDNLRRRFAEHNKGMNASTKYRKPLSLVYYEAYSSRADAKQRERRLKTSAGAQTALKRRIQGCLQGYFV